MATAFQVDAFRNDGFQVDGAAVAVITTGGGFANWSPEVDRAFDRARRAARDAARELRRTLERAFEDKDTAETMKPAVRRRIVNAERNLAAVEAPAFEFMTDSVASLRREIRQFLAADRIARPEMERVIREAERIYAVLLDEEVAIVMLLAG